MTVAHPSRKTRLVHPWMKMGTPSALLILSAVVLRLRSFKSLVEILSQAIFSGSVYPLPTCALLDKRCDHAADRIESYPYRLVFRFLTRQGPRFNSTSRRKCSVAVWRNILGKE